MKSFRNKGWQTDRRPRKDKGERENEGKEDKKERYKEEIKNKGERKNEGKEDKKERYKEEINKKR